MSASAPRLSGRIAVVGAGAVGSLLGGLLARAGEDVTLVGRPPHVDSIRAAGLRIKGILGEFTVPVKASAALDFRPDLLLLAVKTQDVETACGLVQPYARDVPLVTLQNGLRSDEIAAAVLPKGNIISGVVLFNVQFLTPGEVYYARGGSLVIGEAFRPQGRRLGEIRSVLARAVRTEISDDIQGAHCTKLLVNNLANGLEAMTGLHIRECLRHRGLRVIGTLALKEGYQAMAQAGLRLAPLPGIPAPALMLIVRSPLPVAAWVLNLSMGSLRTLSSTLQSLRRGKATEIDYLNGEIVRLGRQVGMATPYNAAIVEVVKEVEGSGRFLPPEDVIRRFSSLRPVAVSGRR